MQSASCSVLNYRTLVDRVVGGSMNDFDAVPRYDRRAACTVLVESFAEAPTHTPSIDGIAVQQRIAMLPFEAWRDAATARIEARVAHYLDQLPQQTPLRAPIAQALSGGKRFRALLALASCEALGGDAASALDAALALEMVQAQSLILDDLPCMDDADTRRGQPALHRQYGEPLALLAAATLLSDAYVVLCSQQDAGMSLRVRTLAEACGCRGIAHGQAAELTAAQHDAAAKTSPLIAASARLGGLCAPISQTYQIEALGAFASNVGLAYQLRDDALDGDADSAIALRDARLALDRALFGLARAGLDTPMLRALARYAVLRAR
jgi:geranylgeranyl diphosphate synthase, type II